LEKDLYEYKILPVKKRKDKGRKIILSGHHALLIIHRSVPSYCYFSQHNNSAKEKIFAKLKQGCFVCSLEHPLVKFQLYIVCHGYT